MLAVLVVLAASNVRRRRVLRRRYHLGDRERAVRLRQQWIEPLVAVVLVGGVLAKDVAAGPAHLVALAVGGVIGAALGALRGRYLLGRARRVGNRLVLERNWQEVLILVLLVGLQMRGSSSRGGPRVAWPRAPRPGATSRTACPASPPCRRHRDRPAGRQRGRPQRRGAALDRARRVRIPHLRVRRGGARPRRPAGRAVRAPGSGSRRDAGAPTVGVRVLEIIDADTHERLELETARLGGRHGADVLEQLG